jgi:hypothetical protein
MDTQLAVRLPDDLAEAFQRVCLADERTVSSELRRLIRRRIAENESARPSAPSRRAFEEPAHEPD